MIELKVVETVCVMTNCLSGYITRRETFCCPLSTRTCYFPSCCVSWLLEKPVQPPGLGAGSRAVVDWYEGAELHGSSPFSELLARSGLAPAGVLLPLALGWRVQLSRRRVWRALVLGRTISFVASKACRRIWGDVFLLWCCHCSCTRDRQNRTARRVRLPSSHILRPRRADWGAFLTGKREREGREGRRRKRTGRSWCVEHEMGASSLVQ